MRLAHVLAVWVAFWAAVFGGVRFGASVGIVVCSACGVLHAICRERPATRDRS